MQQNTSANGYAKCSGYAWVKINEFNMQKIIQTINSYNRILCSSLTNETVEVIDLISSGREFHKVLPLYFIHLWPTELANKSTCKLSLIRVL